MQLLGTRSFQGGILCRAAVILAGELIDSTYGGDCYIWYFHSFGRQNAQCHRLGLMPQPAAIMQRDDQRSAEDAETLERKASLHTHQIFFPNTKDRRSKGLSEVGSVLFRGQWLPARSGCWTFQPGFRPGSSAVSRGATLMRVGAAQFKDLMLDIMCQSSGKLPGTRTSC